MGIFMFDTIDDRVRGKTGMKYQSIFIFAVLLFCLFGCAKGSAWQEQYDLGVRYLSEGNYEEAVIAFTAAIEIDPRQEILYEQLSNAYLEMGNHNRAINILKQGYEATGSASLKELLEALQTRYLAEDWIRPEEWTVNGVPFWEASQEDVVAAYPPIGLEPVWLHSPDFGTSYSGGGMYFRWDEEHDALGAMDFNWDEWRVRRLGYAPVIQHSRGITTEITLNEYLSTIGITQEGIDYLLKALPDWEGYGINLVSKPTEDYLLEVWASTLEFCNLDDGPSYRIDMQYEFYSGMQLRIAIDFSATSGQLDNGLIAANR